MTTPHTNDRAEATNETSQPHAEPARWMATVAIGGASALFGVIVAAWPRLTLALAATLLGIQLVTHGSRRVVDAVEIAGVPVATRVMVLFIGVIAMIVGVLCLTDVVGTAPTFGLLLATCWIRHGIGPILGRDATRPRAARRHDHDQLDDITVSVSSGISVICGLIVLAAPELSAATLTLALGLWLVALGALDVLTGLRLRALLGVRGVRQVGATSA